MEAPNNNRFFKAQLSGDSDLELRTYADNLIEAGNSLEIGAKLANPEPITGAVVLVTVERPSGSKVILPLLDDGHHGDGVADDGYYSVAFYDTFQTGTYRLEYQVNVKALNETPLIHVAKRTVEVQGDAGQGHLNIRLLEGINLIGLNGMAPASRAIEEALSSIHGECATVESYKYQEGLLAYDTCLPLKVNTLKEIDPFQGYWIRTTKPITLQINGPSLLQNVYIPVHPGWNLVPYLSTVATPITEALSSIDGQYLGVRGYMNGAMSYWPQLPDSMNTLQMLEPNLGYWILMTNTHSLLQYPEYVEGPPDYSATAASISLESRRQTVFSNQPQNADGVTPTERWFDLYSYSVTANGSPVPRGTVISVYAPRGRKIGEAVVQTPGWMGVLSVYGKSGFTNEIDGALAGEQLSFAINGIPATATDVNGDPILWTTDGDLQEIILSVKLD